MLDALVVRVKRPPAWQARHPHAYAVLIGLDVLLNALTGGEAYETVSCRVGDSIDAGGWASRVPWPAALRAHFLASEEVVTFRHVGSES